jgi:Uma2 family endonuclease
MFRTRLIMSSILETRSPASGPPPFPLARFTVDQYHRMIESGAFTENDPIELIDGWVVRKMPKGPAHEYVTGVVEELLRERLPPGWHVRNQAPITLSESEPEPDLSIVRGMRGEYLAGHPRPDDLALVIEVSDTTLGTDRIKAATYGRAGIPEYWLINLVDDCVEVYTAPDERAADGYTNRVILQGDDDVRLTLEGSVLDPLVVSTMLP